jgi:GNAT superfamily N-acetyltransferase
MAHGEVYRREFGFDESFEASTARFLADFASTHPDARRIGLGGRLLDTAVEFGRTAGYRGLRSWTNDPLMAAQAMRAGRGFTLTRRESRRAFGLDLMELHYELELSGE